MAVAQQRMVVGGRRDDSRERLANARALSRLMSSVEELARARRSAAWQSAQQKIRKTIPGHEASAAGVRLPTISETPKTIHSGGATTSGGTAPTKRGRGAPKGNRNALKTGCHTREAKAFRAEIGTFLRRARANLAFAKAHFARLRLEEQLKQQTRRPQPNSVNASLTSAALSLPRCRFVSHFSTSRKAVTTSRPAKPLRNLGFSHCVPSYPMIHHCRPCAKDA